MKLIDVIDEDFINYRHPSMTLAFPRCTMKCGKDICQNSRLMDSPNVEIDMRTLVKRYLKNPITKSVVCQGMEPLDSWDDLIEFVEEFRKHTDDDIVIYTGYDRNEVEDKVKILSSFPNIVMKFGRYLPGHKPHYDEILGIYLASDNQYAERI